MTTQKDIVYESADLLINNSLYAILQHVSIRTRQSIKGESSKVVCSADITHSITNLQNSVGKKQSQIIVVNIDGGRCELINGVITHVENKKISIEADSVV